MIDLHCHLDLYPNPHDVARECAARGMYVLSVTNAPGAWRGTVALADGRPRIRTALGLHPQIAHERISELPLFERLLSETRYVGEIGLDGSPECRAHAAVQLRAFTAILRACSNAGGKILSIHSRRATTQVLDLLEAHPDAGTPVLHWFSGTHRELQRAVELGCWFSVGPAMLNGTKGRALVSAMPRGRVITESDGPFTQLDGKPAMPWDISRAISPLAQAWDEPHDAIRGVVEANFRMLVS